MAITGFDYDVSLIEQYANDKGFFYYLARTSKDFFNLVDEPHKGLYLFHAQGNITPNYTDGTGGIISTTYNGTIWIAKVSDLDGVIHEDKIIEVERILSLQIHEDFRRYFCRNYETTISNIRPFYNLMSTNYDGILFDYSIVIDKLFTVPDSVRTNYIENGIYE